jgi:hypothetical protein
MSLLDCRLCVKEMKESGHRYGYVGNAMYCGRHEKSQPNTSNSYSRFLSTPQMSSQNRSDPPFYNTYREPNSISHNKELKIFRNIHKINSPFYEVPITCKKCQDPAYNMLSYMGIEGNCARHDKVIKDTNKIHKEIPTSHKSVKRFLHHPDKLKRVVSPSPALVPQIHTNTTEYLNKYFVPLLPQTLAIAGKIPSGSPFISKN